MFHVITSNGIPIRSIRDYIENFVLVHMYTTELKFGRKPITKFIFDIYHYDGLDENELQPEGCVYTSSTEYEYNFIPVAGILPALDMITATVLRFTQSSLDGNDSVPLSGTNDTTDTVAIAVPYEYSNQIRKYLDDQFVDHSSDIEALDMLRYMKFVKLDRLSASLKTLLNTEFVYQDEPISFAYSVYLGLIGGIT